MKLVQDTLQHGTLATTLLVSAFQMQDFNTDHNHSQSGFRVFLIHCFGHAAKVTLPKLFTSLKINNLSQISLIRVLLVIRIT